VLLRPRYIPFPTQDAPGFGRLILRDGTTAALRPAHPDDAAAMRDFFAALSNWSRLLNAVIAANFRGNIYPINPNAASIGSLSAYRSLDGLPEARELAVIAVPRDAVLGVIDDCAAHGVRAVVVITAGFAEIGAEGRELERRLVEKVRGHGMRMVGPNCLGMLNTDPAVRLNASFAPDFPPPGRIAFSSQSGALGLAIMSQARRRGLGLSKFVSVGNKADVSGNDLLQYWEQDEKTDVILLYLESFGNPRRFARIAKRVSRHKPIVAVKAGRTGAGKRAASSHTAALSASDTAVDALFHQTGVIRAESLDELFDLAAALSTQPLPHGRRVALLTNAGGLGILCADACEASGPTVGELSQAAKGQLKEFLPATASVANPVDMIASASADDFRRAVEILLADRQVDALIVLTIHVEILKDICFRVTPITDKDAKEMVRSIRGYRLLEGYRGHPPADIDAIENLLLRVARLVEEVPEIAELDLNPVIALPPGQGCLIVDARIRVVTLEQL